MESFPTISTVFVLEPQDLADKSNRDPSLAIESAFSLMLPLLNHTSTCILIGRGSAEDPIFFYHAYETIKGFLEEYTFLQVTLRPVHMLSPGTADKWLRLYRHFLASGRSFHEEGYREQIVSRLRVFPVLFFPDRTALETGRLFLQELHKNFFLPSILFPRTLAFQIEDRSAEQALPVWERTFLLDAARFHLGKVLQTMVSYTLIDKLLELKALSGPVSEEPLCKEILILDEEGGTRNCFLDRNGHADTFGCGICIQDALDQTEMSFRLNGRIDAWREACESAAACLKKLNRTEDALRITERCIQGYATGELPTYLRIQKALLLYEKGDLEGAMVELEASRRVEPHSAVIRYYMGLCEFGWRDYIEAADRFREAVELGLSGPMKQEAEYFRGESHCHLEEYEDALKALTSAEEGGKLDSPLFFYKGLGLLGMGRPDEAIAELKKALSLGPTPGDVFHVLFYIAHACKESENYTEAVHYCKKALRLEGKSQEAHNLLGFCYFKLKRYDEAICCFEKVIEIDPTSAIDYANIGSNLREKGDVEGAVAMYRKALSLDPNIDFARESLERLEKELR